jgi:hypothetical protein
MRMSFSQLFSIGREYLLPYLSSHIRPHEPRFITRQPGSIIRIA